MSRNLVCDDCVQTEELRSVLDKEEQAFTRRLVAKCKNPLCGQDAFNLLSTNGVKADLITQIAAEQDFEEPSETTTYQPGHTIMVQRIPANTAFDSRTSQDFGR